MRRKSSTVKKEKILITIRKDLVDKFRSLLMQKYPKYEKGILSYEVELALNYWINLHTKAQSSETSKINPINPTPKVLTVFLTVKDYLLRKYYDELHPGSQVIDIHLREAIANVRGADERTIKKWLKRFTENKLIKHVAGAVWEIM
ncbi:MAG: hypothetical protein QXJ45_08250 [Thermoproteota archaeon]